MREDTFLRQADSDKFDTNFANKYIKHSKAKTVVRECDWFVI